MSDIPPPSPWSTGYRGRCPQCGEGRLYQSFLKVAERCSNCGLELSKHDAGDGAVPFVILLVGAISVGIGAFLLIAFDAPVWVPIAVIVPLTILLVLLILPKAKGLLIALQYVNQAGDTGHDSFSAPD